MKRLSQIEIKNQLFWTNGCFRAAMLEHYDAHLSEKEKHYNHKALYRLIRSDWQKEIDPEVNTIYLRNLLALSSDKLSIILKATQTGQQHRKQETIDAIMTELFERSANPETRGEHA